MKTVYIIIGVAIVGVVIYFIANSSGYKSSSSSTAVVQTAPASSVAGNSVTISNFAFSPASLEVKVGDKVTFTNNDSTTHTITSGTGVFNSGNVAAGKSFEYTFKTAGAFPYHCSIHPSMTGTIIVK